MKTQTNTLRIPKLKNNLRSPQKSMFESFQSVAESEGKGSSAMQFSQIYEGILQHHKYNITTPRLTKIQARQLERIKDKQGLLQKGEEAIPMATESSIDDPQRSAFSKYSIKEMPDEK